MPAFTVTPAPSLAHVIAHNPQARDAHHTLGNYLQTEGRYREAHAAYDTALELRPDSPDLLNNIGVLLARQDRHEEAVAALPRGAAA